VGISILSNRSVYKSEIHIVIHNAILALGSPTRIVALSRLEEANSPLRRQGQRRIPGVGPLVEDVDLN